MHNYLAAYEGPGGPISAEFEATSLDVAVRGVRVSSQQWFDDAANDLDVPPDAVVPTDRLRGWERVPIEDLPLGWRLYEETPV